MLMTQQSLQWERKEGRDFRKNVNWTKFSWKFYITRDYHKDRILCFYFVFIFRFFSLLFVYYNHMFYCAIQNIKKYLICFRFSACVFRGERAKIFFLLCVKILLYSICWLAISTYSYHVCSFSTSFMWFTTTLSSMSKLLIQEKREEKKKKCVYFCAEVCREYRSKNAFSSSIIHFIYV